MNYRVSHIAWPLIVISVLMVIAAGCEEHFEPLQENDRYFYSIYGYLDASADTQWVRVTPLHKSIFPGTEVTDSVDAKVTLEHLESGQVAVMHDSLFTYARKIAYAYNFWTTMDLQPGQSYRLRAERSDGAFSVVTVTLPDTFPQPRIAIPADRFDPDDPDLFSPDTLVMRGIERLADVQAIYHVRNRTTGESLVSFVPHLKDSTDRKRKPGELRVLIRPRDDLDRVEEEVRRQLAEEPFDIGDYELTNCQLFVAGAGPEYPKFHILSELVVTLPDGISNVENGVGFLAGIVSRTFYYPTYPVPEQSALNPAPCPKGL